MGLAIRVFH